MPVGGICGLWTCLGGFFFIIVIDIRRSILVVGRVILWVGDSGLYKMEKVSWAQTTKHSLFCFLQTADTTWPVSPIPAAWLPTTMDCTFNCLCQGILSQWQGHQLRHHLTPSYLLQVLSDVTMLPSCIMESESFPLYVLWTKSLWKNTVQALTFG